MSRANRRPDMELLGVVGQVRRRWRLKLFLRGLVITLAGGLLTFLLSATGLETLRFQPGAIEAFRWVLWIGVAALLIWTVVIPLFRRIPDERVALYLEEHEPALQSQLLAAVESSGKAAPPDTELARAIVDRAVDQVRRMDNGRSIERPAIRRSSGMLGGLTLASVLILFLGPGYLRHGARALFFPTRAAEAVNPYSVTVEPGDTTISRSADQRISAALHGFESDEVGLYVSRGGSSTFDQVPMIEDGAGRFESLLLNVADETRYYVESSGVRSGTFTLRVADLPAIDQLRMEYVFPAYTGLAPRSFEYGGDVAALAGTTVHLSVTPTLETPGARIVMESGDTISMAPGAEGTWNGSLQVQGPGYYGIQLQTHDGSWVAGAPDYQIDVLTDQGPSISFNKPGRDTQVSSIEEVFLEARADDDFGVADVSLVVSVNGGAPDTLSIFSNRSLPLAEVTAGHTIFMEELELEVGDLISYFGIATDNAPSAARALTDIYFLQVRPFQRDYREAQGGGGQGGQGGGAMEQELSALQRQIIAASFNLVRDRESYPPDVWDENVVSVALTQQRLQEQVQTLRERIVNRGITGADEAFRVIAEALPQAVEAMAESEELLRKLDPGGAIAPQQQALRHLQQAEETYERFVSLSPQQGGGGGQGNTPDAEDLADLFELELDKLRNQYETVQRSQQETADDQVDETLERVRELARRQEQELERQRRRAAAQQGGGGGAGSQSARELAEEAEEAARQLERLSRESGNRQLDEISRQLQQSAEAMRQSAANGGSAGVSEAQEALRRLRDVRDQLEGVQDDRLQRDLADATDRAAELARQQADVQNRIEAMRETGEASADQVGRIQDTKVQMAEEAEQILSTLDELAGNARQAGRTGAEELEEAATTIRETQLRERLLYSRGLVGAGDPEFTEAFENQTGQAIQSLRNRLDEAAEAVSSAENEDLETEALESARDLVRSLESVERRLEQRSGAGGAQGAAGADSAAAQASGQGAGEPRQQQGEGQQAGEGQGQGEGQQQGQGQAGAQAEGQGGQRGGQGQAGDSRNAGPGGPAVNGGDPGRIRGGGRQPFDAEDVRQLRREFRERAQEAQELAGLLERADVDPQDLATMIEAMRALDRDRTYDDPEEVLRLQRLVLEGMKQLEFRLRRDLAEDQEQLLLDQAGEVPEGFRALVEEYYRALSRGTGN